MPPIVVDTNILFSALLSDRSRFTEFIFKSEYNLFICELVLVELFKRKEKIIRLSQLTENDLIQFYHILLRRINLYKEDLITIENRSLAYEFCRDVDESDTPHVALTL
jgi:predicted nucleic acid-binding protein